MNNFSLKGFRRGGEKNNEGRHEESKNDYSVVESRVGKKTQSMGLQWGVPTEVLVQSRLVVGDPVGGLSAMAEQNSGL